MPPPDLTRVVEVESSESSLAVVSLLSYHFMVVFFSLLESPAPPPLSCPLLYGDSSVAPPVRWAATSHPPPFAYGPQRKTTYLPNFEAGEEKEGKKKK